MVDKKFGLSIKKQNHKWAGESGCQQLKIKKKKSKEDWQII
jgi:hypothetical protein